MASMFSLFSRDPLKEFPYEQGELVFENADVSNWSLFHAKKKAAPNETYSLFASDLTTCSDAQKDRCRLTVKRLKTMKHPNILGFVDSLETEKVIWLVTEEVKPLDEYLRQQKMSSDQKEMAISWGLYQIASVIKFLGVDAKMIHNNLNIFSIFVTNNGEWKLAGLEYVLTPDDVRSGNIPSKLFGLDKYSSPELKSGAVSGKDALRVDSWGLGCVMWEVFNGTLPAAADLRSVKSIPTSLHKLYAALISQAPGKRPTADQFIREAKKGFMRNKFVDTLLFLEEFQLKEPKEKAAFFGTLKEELDMFPEDISRKKILPQLVHAYQYGEAGSSVLAPLFKLGKILSDEEYQEHIVPCVVKLFSSTDRVTRVKLLDRIEDFVSHLSPSVVNEKIFPQLVAGFLDTNPAVREATVKAMIHLAPKLNHNNLNIELMKHFARLQSKSEPLQGIRTNTTICLGKIGSYLHPKDRQKILIAAFTRALKDPFPPARIAGVLGLSATQQYYPLMEIANRVLPCLCQLTMDPEKQVRDQGFKAIKGFMTNLEKASENPEIIPELESQVNAGSGSLISPDKVPAWAGWALSALSGRFYKSPTPPKPGPDGQSPSQTAVSQNDQPSPSAAGKRSESSRQSSLAPSSVSRDASEEPTGKKAIDDGWDEDDDEWGSLEDYSSSPVINEPVKPKPAQKGMHGWGEEKMSEAVWDEDDDVADEDVGGGWGDEQFDDSLSAFPAPSNTKSNPSTSRTAVGSGSTGAKSGMKLGAVRPKAKQLSGDDDILREMGATDWSKPLGAASSGADGKKDDGWSTASSVKDGSEGWGDGEDEDKETDGWGDDGFTTTSKPAASKPTKAALQSRNEERKAQLEAKRAAKKSGAMKLSGVKKATPGDDFFNNF